MGEERVRDFFLQSIENAFDSSIVLQLDTEMRHYYLGKYMTIQKNAKRIPRTLYGEDTYLKLYRMNKVISFSNIHTWISYLGTRDLSINTRFHGSVASIIAGIPTIVIPIDSRMKELADYHKLTTIEPDSLIQHSDLNYWIEKLDFKSCEKVSIQNFRHYLDFLNANGIDSIYENGVRIQESKYDKKIGAIPWIFEASFDQVSAVEKLRRIINVYSPSIKKSIRGFI